MVVGMSVGPNRISGLDIKDAMGKNGLYAFPDQDTILAGCPTVVQQAGSRALARSLAFHENPQPTISYPPDLLRDGSEEPVSSAPAPEMPPEQAAIHATRASLFREMLAGANGSAIEPQPDITHMPDSLAA